MSALLCPRGQTSEETAGQSVQMVSMALDTFCQIAVYQGVGPRGMQVCRDLAPPTRNIAKLRYALSFIFQKPEHQYPAEE